MTIMSGVTGLRYNFNRGGGNGSANYPSNSFTPNNHMDLAASSLVDSPLFERTMPNDEYSEFQQLRNIIDGLTQRISKLEKINVDLEARLEDQAKQSMAVETELIAMERSWRAKCENLNQEISKWKLEYEGEKLKNNKLRDHLTNTEREVYTILQRKHELMRGGGGTMGPGGAAGGPSGIAGSSKNGTSGALRKGGDAGSSDPDLYQMGNKVSL
jgi:hypothetical protein